ncbi:MAG: Na/Pi cotransporter family protein [Lachnospiraceae bacterium]|nr:Na/Pi cotransporter family protein [Lachnospiraceae bacterium]
MDIFSVFTLFGGLAFFLYGMNVLSTGLERMAGGKLERSLKKVTANPIKSLLFGMGVTIAIQSSSAMTVMLVGFVNSGIMELQQTIGIIMGSNIGTTLTAWVLSLAGIESNNFFLRLLKPESFSPIIAVIGILFIMVSKKRKNKNIGTVMIGFSILMYGMNLMGAAVAPLAESSKFTELLVLFRNPILGVLVGTIFTGVIQSSAASVGILQALSMTGNITFGMAIPIIMGQNIGTCVTALLSSIGVSKNAKRVAVVHIYFNIIGTIFCLLVFYTGNAIFHFDFIEKAIRPIGIAGVHSIFNIVTTALLFPFVKQLEQLAKLTVKSDEKEKQIFLDERLLATPSVAIAECHNRALEMLDIVKKSVEMSTDLVKRYQAEMMEEIWKNEEKTDTFEDNLGTYLLKLGGKRISDKDSREVSKILHTIGDMERIGDHALNIAKVSAELHNKNLVFSKEAQEEIAVLTAALSQILIFTSIAYTQNDISNAKKVEPLEQVIDIMCDELKEMHVRRLRKGECTIEVGFIFNDLIANVQRISDHCSNIAVCIIRVNDSTFDTHEYLQKIKDAIDGQYVDDFNYFKKLYAIKESAI